MVDWRRLRLSILCSRLFRLAPLIFLFVTSLNLWLSNWHLRNELTRLQLEKGRAAPCSPVVADWEFLPSADAIREAELVKGKSYTTEMDLPRFAMFTSESMFLLERGLGDRVVERLFASKDREIKQVIATGDKLVKLSGVEDDIKFLYGLVRLLPRSGFHYELVYRNRVGKENFVRKITLWRPFGQLRLVQNEVSNLTFPVENAAKLKGSIFSASIDNSKPTIHVVLTATSNRLGQILAFLENNYVVLGKSTKKPLNFDLTLVTFVADSTEQASIRAAVNAKLEKINFDLTVDYVPLIGANFSRGLGLHSGIAKVARNSGTDPLIFTTDVDIIVTPHFLSRCRLNAERGQRIYFPLVFSLFNPRIVYPHFLNKTMPKLVRDLLKIHDQTGWWRDFGYGMSCFYKSDYDKVGGFDASLTKLSGWGDEDLGLFRKFVKSDLLVVRAIDPGIFHIYHPKHCDAAEIGQGRYKNCLASQARNELSHRQLGIMCLQKSQQLN